MKRLLALFFLMIFFSACSSDRVPSGIIGQDEMVSILTDIHLADGFSSVKYADSSGRQVAMVYQAVYKKYGTDSAQVRKSLDYYITHADKLQAMYVKINAALQEMQVTQQKLDELEFQKRQQRMIDSLHYLELRRDTLNRGFIIDTVPVYPLKKWIVRKNGAGGGTPAGQLPPAKNSPYPPRMP